MSYEPRSVSREQSEERRVARWHPYALNSKPSHSSQLTAHSSKLLLLHTRDDKLISLTMDVDDLEGIVLLQVLTQLGDIDVHATSIEVVVIDPDGLQRKVALQDFVCMSAQ